MTRRLLTTGAVAKRLSLSTSRVVQYVQMGRLTTVERDSSGRRLFDAEEVEAFAQKRERDAARAAA